MRGMYVSGSRTRFARQLAILFKIVYISYAIVFFGAAWSAVSQIMVTIPCIGWHDNIYVYIYFLNELYLEARIFLVNFFYLSLRQLKTVENKVDVISNKKAFSFSVVKEFCN